MKISVKRLREIISESINDEIEGYDDIFDENDPNYNEVDDDMYRPYSSYRTDERSLTIESMLKIYDYHVEKVEMMDQEPLDGFEEISSLKNELEEKLKGYIGDYIEMYGRK